MSAHDEFYIGYLDRAPPATGRRTRSLAVALVLLLALVSGALAFAQRAFEPSFHDFGNVRTWRGTIAMTPQPTLVIDSPGGARSRLPLVGPFKSGAGPHVAEADGRAVELRATLIARDGRSMLEVEGGEAGVRILDDVTPAPQTDASPLGERTFHGEIVDSKCFMGVMNPGETKVHRACAVRCISGGIPPVLLVRDNAGRATYLVLVGAEGEMVNDRVLGLVAEPVRVTGALERHDDLLVLRADPDTIERL